MVNFWKHNKILVIIGLFLILLLPNAVMENSIANERMICVGIGVDKNDDEYELSAQVVVPMQNGGFSQKLEVYTSSGDSIKDCILNMRLHLGKLVGVAHCSFMVVNEEVLNGNLITVLDYLVRELKINFNCVVIATDKKSKDVLTVSATINNSQDLNIPELLDYNNQYVYSKSPNIDEIFSSFFSGSPNYVLSLITLKDQSVTGVNAKGEVGGQGSGSGSQSGGSSGGGGSGSQGGESKKEQVLSNDGDVVFMNKSQSIGKINYREGYGVRYFINTNKHFRLGIEDFTDELYTNADIELYSQDKAQINRYYFENGVPIIELNIIQYLGLSSIKQKEMRPEFYQADMIKFTMALKEACKQKIEKDIQDGFKILQDYNADTVEAYNYFEKYAYREFHKFLDGLQNKEEYLKHIKVKINLSIQSRKD